MANEPERPIEKLLRAAARKRRDDAGPPFELHPADRRLLQAEVSRKFAKPQRQGRSFTELMGQWWPRLAGGVAILAVLVLAVWVLLPEPGNHKPEALLAKNLPPTKAMPAQGSLPAAAPAPAAVALSSGPAAKTEPAMVAYSDTTPPARGGAARQLGAVASPVPAESAVAEPKSQDADKLALVAALKPTGRRDPAMPLLATSRDTTPPAPTGVVNGALELRYGFAGQPAAPASLPSEPVAPTAIAMAPTASGVSPAAQPVNLADALNRQPAEAPRATADGVAQLARKSSSEQGRYLRSSAGVASANRPNPSPLASYDLSVAAPEVSQKVRALSVAQHFVQVPTEEKAKDNLAARAAAPHPVLASFRVEQEGQVLRIVDDDGSVYIGSVQLANAARRASSATTDAAAVAFRARATARAPEQEAAANPDTGRVLPQTYSFRVAGTNRSLQKKVIFTGNLLTATNLILSLSGATNRDLENALEPRESQDVLSYRATNLAIGRGPAASANAPAQQSLLGLLNSRISGKVVVGSGKPVEINALPASP